MGKIISTTTALVAANFLYQAMTSHLWAVAIERSYFQIVAIAIITVWLWLDGTLTRRAR